MTEVPSPKRINTGTVLLVASLTMVATLPGRTVGLGLITERLLVDLALTRGDFAALNLWATFIGALFILGTGPALDRSLRWTSTAVLVSFSGAVFWLSKFSSAALLLPALILIRGLGQSSLSLCSVSIVGKSLQRNRSAAMGLFAVITSLLFVGAIPTVTSSITHLGWRQTWSILALVVLVIGLLVAVLVRRHQSPRSLKDADESKAGKTLGEALHSPALWILTAGIGIYYFAFTGITLFSESLVTSLGFDKEIRDWVLAMMMLFGLLSNLGCGWLAQRIPILCIFGGSMIIFAGCLFGFPLASGSMGLILAVSAALGIGSGAVTVIFFTGFADLFGNRNLGKIQGIAQAVTVGASGTGPLFFASMFESPGSYSSVFFTLAPLSLLIGAWAFYQQTRENLITI
ncbi:MAG: MFS transporter [Akkermansiaceae bacterium]